MTEATAQQFLRRLWFIENRATSFNLWQIQEKQWQTNPLPVLSFAHLKRRPLLQLREAILHHIGCFFTHCVNGRIVKMVKMEIVDLLLIYKHQLFVWAVNMYITFTALYIWRIESGAKTCKGFHLKIFFRQLYELFFPKKSIFNLISVEIQGFFLVKS